jgi:HTH-type transcriptional regulator, sugar sensing transcriptional regulator
MIDAQSLIPLGLTAYEAAAYLALLSRSSLTPPEIAARAKLPRQRVYDVLASLAAKGLCVEYGANPKTFSAVDPKIALELLTMEATTRLERQKQESAELAGRLAGELATLFATGRAQNDPLAYVEVLAGTARIAHRAVALANEAAHTVRSCIKNPLILSEPQNDTFLQAPLKNGLHYHALCDTQMLQTPATRLWLEGYRERGMNLRVATDLPIKMQLFDAEVALLSMQDPAGGPPSFTAVAIRNRGVVAMLSLAFENLWQQATPL